MKYPLAYGYACVGKVVEVGNEVNSEWLNRVVFAFQPHTSHFITKPENPEELETKLRSLLKNVEELSSIRRGTGSLEATAVSAQGPGSFEVRQFFLWGVFALILLALVVFAYAVGVL